MNITQTKQEENRDETKGEEEEEEKTRNEWGATR